MERNKDSQAKFKLTWKRVTLEIIGVGLIILFWSTMRIGQVRELNSDESGYVRIQLFSDRQLVVSQPVAISASADKEFMLTTEYGLKKESRLAETNPPGYQGKEFHFIPESTLEPGIWENKSGGVVDISIVEPDGMVVSRLTPGSQNGVENVVLITFVLVLALWTILVFWS